MIEIEKYYTIIKMILKKNTIFYHDGEEEDFYFSFYENLVVIESSVYIP